MRSELYDVEVVWLTRRSGYQSSARVPGIRNDRLLLLSQRGVWDILHVYSPANSGASRVDPASPVGSDTSCQASTQRRHAPPGQGLDPDPRSARPPTPINVGSGSKESSWGRQVVSRHARRRAAHISI